MKIDAGFNLHVASWLRTTFSIKLKKGAVDMGKSGAKGDSYYGKVAANYEKRRAKQGWWKVEQEEMLSLLETLPEGLSVLDVPFGTGRFVPYYVDRGFTIHGLDASIEMLSAARKSLGDNFNKCKVSVGSAMEMDFNDNQFDLLVSTRFLRDIIVAKDAKKALSEFARVTKQYAIIQLGENTQDYSEEIDPEVILESKLSAGANAELLGEVGFEVIEKRLVNSDSDANSNIYHILCRKAAHVD
jgi:ubiquinone/menaquinone biosynthesis C-methylase UbiE